MDITITSTNYYHIQFSFIPWIIRAHHNSHTLEDIPNDHFESVGPLSITLFDCDYGISTWINEYYLCDVIYKWLKFYDIKHTISVENRNGQYFCLYIYIIFVFHSVSFSKIEASMAWKKAFLTWNHVIFKRVSMSIFFRVRFFALKLCLIDFKTHQD